MNTLTFRPLAKKLSFDSDNMWVDLTDGQQICVHDMRHSFIGKHREADKVQQKETVLSVTR
ncbi:MAG: hypothetical protein DRI57_01830 [Deltaproteobacteria bacterium]|nr:MAG: hypothetical protein DRI57_01830 [Deltaproteobacteria bacterium]